MSLVVNNNMMAANTARNLNAHYGRLATSTQRLSSGLRVNSAADDAAGLAIRELQRADIAALHQGARNANDAISMIQVADGSLGIIDEKLIRMKELAEQAATGTYDSTQRLMIESEYQAMASEITRIANATDFNGTKLLDGTLAGEHDGSGLVSEGKIKIHFGTGNDSAEDYYYVEIGEVTSQALGLGNASTWQDVQRRGIDAFKTSLKQQIRDNKDLSDQDKAKLLASVDDMVKEVNDAISGAIQPDKAYELWAANDVLKNPDGSTTGTDEGFLVDGKNWIGNSQLMSDFLAAGAGLATAGAPATQADDKVVAEIQTEAQNLVNQIWTDIDTEVGKATPTDQDTAVKAYTDAIDKAIATAKTSKIDATVADNLAQTLKDAVTANSTGLWDGANNNVDAFVKGSIDSALQDAIKADTALANAAFDAAQKNMADNLVTDATAITDAVTKAFGDSLSGALNGTPGPTNQADIDGFIDTAITAAETVAKKLDMSDDNWIAVKTALETIKGKGWDGTATPPALDPNFNPVDEAATAIDDNQAATQAIDETAKNNETRKNAITNAQNPATAPAANGDLKTFWNGLRETEKQKLQYAWGQAAIYNLAFGEPTTEPANYGLDATIGSLSDLAGLQGDAATIADAIMKQALKDMHQKVGHMDFAGHTIETQEDAQMALDAINEAIVSKDKIRAHLGAAQNRLENTVSNLNIQAENLQSAESRISDVDVATEMTQFVRNQILTQSAVAMLSQANSLPQMAMQLIGG